MSSVNAEVPAAVVPQPQASTNQYSTDAHALANDVLSFDKTASNDAFNGLTAEWQSINDKDRTNPGYVMGVATASAAIMNQSDQAKMPYATFNNDGSMSFDSGLPNTLESDLTHELLGAKGAVNNLWPGGGGYATDLVNNLSYGGFVGTGGGDGTGDGDPIDSIQSDS